MKAYIGTYKNEKIATFHFNKRSAKIISEIGKSVKWVSINY